MSDLIDRQAAIDECYPVTVDGEVYEVVQVETLMGLPSAQPERQKGEWIEISSISHTYKCSECGRLLVNITDGKNNVARNYPYCHCGADMRGEQE